MKKSKRFSNSRPVSGGQVMKDAVSTVRIFSSPCFGKPPFRGIPVNSGPASGLLVRSLIILLCITGCERRNPLPEPDTRDTKRIPSATAVRGSENPGAYERETGYRLFEHYCVHCHGTRGAGNGLNAFALQTSPRNLASPSFQEGLSDSSLAEMIRLGGRSASVSPQMPAYGFTLTDDEIGFLITAIRAFR